jgi:type II secretory pathway pseudopilin PulG
MTGDRTVGHELGRSRRGKTSGLTILQVVMALAILAVAAFTSLSYYVLSQIRLNVEEDTRSALELCQSQMEQDRTVAFSSLPTLNNTTSSVSINSVIKGTMATTVQDFTENAQVAYRLVTVQVSWVEDGQTLTVKLLTYRSPYR